MYPTSSSRAHASLILMIIVATRHVTGFLSSSTGGKHASHTEITHALVHVENLRRGGSHLSVGALSEAVPQYKTKNKASEEFKWLNWVYKQWKPKNPGELSEEVIKQMVPAISRWGQRKDLGSAERAEELLERIIEENIARNPHAILTVAIFNAAMNGHARLGNPSGAQRILRRMEELRSKYDHLAHLKPDVFSMSTLATAWAKSRSPEAAAKALNILHYMDVEKISPNTITYNAVLHALATGHQIDKAIIAEDVVKKMEDQSAVGTDCKPDIFSYQCLIQAWANTPLPGSPQKAEQILRFLDQQAEKGNTGLEPNVYCFTSESIVVHMLSFSTTFVS